MGSEAEALCPALTLDAGDIVMFGGYSVHWTQPVANLKSERLSLVGRFVEGRARHNGMPITALSGRLNYSQSILNSCIHGLSAGDNLSGVCFPRIFPKAVHSDFDSNRKHLCAAPCDQCVLLNFV